MGIRGKLICFFLSNKHNVKANYNKEYWINFFKQIIAAAETKRSNTKSDR